MVAFAFIGGKVNRERINNRIEKHLIDLTKKENPCVLFCPYAVKNIDRSIEKFHKLMEGLPARIVDLTLENVDRFDELLADADILYIGGGMSDDLVEFFINHKLDLVLRKYMNTDKIYAGSSAGAMLYTVISMGDKYMYTDNYHSYNYKMVKGLGLLNISMCPHYQNEDLIIYNDEIKSHKLVSFGIEEDTCLIVMENKFYCIKDDQRMSLYYFNPRNNFVMKPIYEGEEYEDSSIRP